jgi:hypothetical protein
LLCGVADSGAFQNRCIYTEIITLNPNKNPFKLQVVMQQNRKNTKEGE